MKKTFLFLLFPLFSIYAQDFKNSVGVNYRYGTFDNEINASGFEFSYQREFYNWLYAEASVLHLNGTNFNNNTLLSNNNDQIENIKRYADRAMFNAFNLKLNVSFINNNRHLMSAFYGLSFYRYDSSTYTNFLDTFFYENEFNSGLGTIFGLNYFYKLYKHFLIGVDFMMFSDRKMYGPNVLVNNYSVGLNFRYKF